VDRGWRMNDDALRLINKWTQDCSVEPDAMYCHRAEVRNALRAAMEWAYRDAVTQCLKLNFDRNVMDCVKVLVERME